MQEMTRGKPRCIIRNQIIRSSAGLSLPLQKVQHCCYAATGTARSQRPLVELSPSRW